MKNIIPGLRPFVQTISRLIISMNGINQVSFLAFPTYRYTYLIPCQFLTLG